MKHLIIFCLILNFPFYVKAQSINEHTVSTGETLQTIASRYGVSILEIKTMNPGLNDYIFAGMVLKIPSKQENTIELHFDDLKDIIYLKDGSELVAKILSIESNQVKFEQYDTDVPFTISKNEISAIKFEDGRISELTVQQKKNTTKTKKIIHRKKATR